MEKYKIRSSALFIISITLIAFSCNKNATSPDEGYEYIDEASVTLSTNSILTRNVFYNTDTINRNNADTNDYKAVYTFQEIQNVLVNTDTADWLNHKGIFVDDDCYYKNIYELMHYSYDVILGYVLKAECKWGEIEGTKCIYTYVKLQNIKSFKNQIYSDVISINDFGGRIGDISSDILYDPCPIYEDKELVLVTLKKEDVNFSTFGRAQGKFSVSLTSNEEL